MTEDTIANVESNPTATGPMGIGRSENNGFYWMVDCESDDTFLFAPLSNTGDLGVFVRTVMPLPAGTTVGLQFAPRNRPAFELAGVVAWINPLREDGDNPNPGMGIRVLDLGLDERERLVEAVRTIAYLREQH